MEYLKRLNQEVLTPPVQTFISFGQILSQSGKVPQTITFQHRQNQMTQTNTVLLDALKAIFAINPPNQIIYRIYS